MAIDGTECRKPLELIRTIDRTAALRQQVDLPLSRVEAFYRKPGMEDIIPCFHPKARSVDHPVPATVTLPRDVSMKPGQQSPEVATMLLESYRTNARGGAGASAPL